MLTLVYLGLAISALAFAVVPTYAASPLETADVTAVTTAATGMIGDLVDLLISLTPVIALLAVGFIAISWVKGIARGRIG